MKRIFTFLLAVFAIQIASAASGVFEYFLDTKLNGTVKTHGNYGGGTNFVGSNLGTVSSTSNTLVIDLVGLKTFKNSGSNVTGATLFYRVYKQGATVPGYTSVNMPFFANLGGGGDQQWQEGTDVNLLVGNTAIGTYNVDVYITAGTSDGGAGYASATSPFTATFMIDMVLAADLTAFKGSATKGQNILDWSTASEKNATYFDIQRSKDNANWLSVGQVKAVNRAFGSNYQFIDLQPSSGTNYYRLKMVDANGSTELSKIVAVNASLGNKLLQIYPNPAKDVLTVIPDVDTEGVSIFDVNGRLVLSVIDQSQQVNIQNLASGIYIVRMMDKMGFVGSPVRFMKQ